jgi:hypothetical protein
VQRTGEILLFLGFIGKFCFAAKYAIMIFVPMWSFWPRSLHVQRIGWSFLS